jgi:hypothetical protein
MQLSKQTRESMQTLKKLQKTLNNLFTLSI